jgi:hypothetical protein
MIETPPKYEYIPDFLAQEESAELWARLERTRGFALEIGQCNGAKPSHTTIQYGPRQAYLSCVPKPFRVGSSGDVPDFLQGLKTRLEEKYNCYFNSIQINKHFDQDATVLSHTDSPPGYICMVSLGAERPFQLSSRSYKSLARLQPTDGSLLTFFPKDQYRMVHSMPRNPIPCGARYSLIFRYITEGLTKPGAIDKQSAQGRKQRNAERMAEYEAVQAAYKLGGYSAVQECQRLRGWETHGGRGESRQG